MKRVGKRKNIRKREFDKWAKSKRKWKVTEWGRGKDYLEVCSTGGGVYQKEERKQWVGTQKGRDIKRGESGEVFLQDSWDSFQRGINNATRIDKYI